MGWWITPPEGEGLNVVPLNGMAESGEFTYSGDENTEAFLSKVVVMSQNRLYPKTAHCNHGDTVNQGVLFVLTAIIKAKASIEAFSGLFSDYETWFSSKPVDEGASQAPERRTSSAECVKKFNQYVIRGYESGFTDTSLGLKSGLMPWVTMIDDRNPVMCVHKDTCHGLTRLEGDRFGEPYR